MIAKKFRLPSGAASWRNRHPERKIDSLYFSLKIFPNDLDYNRFASVISNRVDKRSARRHFWKRRILDYLKNFFGIKPARSGAGRDFLIFVQPAINQLKTENSIRQLAEDKTKNKKPNSEKEKNFREEFDKIFSANFN